MKKRKDKGKNLHCFIQRELFDKAKTRADFLGITVTDALHESLKLWVNLTVTAAEEIK